MKILYLASSLDFDEWVLWHVGGIGKRRDYFIRKGSVRVAELMSASGSLHYHESQVVMPFFVHDPIFSEKAISIWENGQNRIGVMKHCLH